MPEAILRHDVALYFDHIFDRAGADVGDAPVIAFDNDVFLQAREIETAIELREWAIDEIPERDGGGNCEDAE